MFMNSFICKWKNALNLRQNQLKETVNSKYPENFFLILGI